MKVIPQFLLKKLYTKGSLKNTKDGVQIHLKNRLADAVLTTLRFIEIGGDRVEAGKLKLTSSSSSVQGDGINSENSFDFPLKSSVLINLSKKPLLEGSYTIKFNFETTPFGTLEFEIEDKIGQADESENVDGKHIPRNLIDDYSEEAISSRQDFVSKFSGKKCDHIKSYSFDPHITEGNSEHFTGVAQVPLGFAGPLKVNGTFAKGEFIIPLATSEGTLIASYNRGMKVLNESGGVRTTIQGDNMQRAPVFVFDSAQPARDFCDWVVENMENIRRESESTSNVAKLKHIDYMLSNKFAFLRFNYTTGDAAGQNMVGKATLAGCNWILKNYEGIEDFFLESNFGTDKKASFVNMMRSRGKRVCAEAVVKNEVLERILRVSAAQIVKMSSVVNVGAMLAGANNNGAHSANGIAALFIATGQDVANVAESSAAIEFTELTKDGDLYISITIPSLVVGTYGGGTGLATQRECLEFLDCYGEGKVKKFAEIVAGVVLAGELSLGSAIASSEWVASHERLGRNR